MVKMQATLILILIATLTASGVNSVKFDSKSFERIVNGEEAEPHSIPYQVALQITKPENERRSFCGGTLISRNFVMTAAHCADGATDIEVIFGAHEVSEPEETQVHINSTEFIVHELWNWTTIENDVALIKLPRPAPINDYIQIVNLPGFSEIEETYVGETARGSGWGKVSDESSVISPVLRQVYLEIITNEDCNKVYNGSITQSHICSNSPNQEGPCNGDSGGPLALQGDKQIGIASFVSDWGCEAGWPAGWTRITTFLDWIAEHSDADIPK